MPIVDMPLEQLRSYKGISPRPDDFDAYWERGLAEMEALDYQMELIPAEITSSYAECYHMYFTGTKGARIYAKYMRPKNAKNPCPAALFFHGYSGSSGDFSNYLNLVAEGYCVAALDVRGQGGKSQDIGGIVGNTLHGHITRGIDDQPDNLLYRDIFLDTALLAKIVSNQPEVDAERICATGRSQGGALTLVCVALAPYVKRALPVYPFLSDYLRVWEMDLAVAAYEDVRQYLRTFDPLHQRKDEIFRKLGYIDIQNLMPRIKGEVLFVTGMMDTICPPSTQFAAYNKITSKKDMILYPDFGHEDLPGMSDTQFSFITKPW